MARLSVALGSRERRTELALHPGWLPILALLAWLGAMWQGPQAYPEQGVGARWLLGAALAFSALASVAFRELLRWVILRQYGIRLQRLTLYPYGGAARLSPSLLPWRRQALLALAGPLASGGLAILFGAIWLLSRQPFFSWLALFNLSLALFTLAPARPLDGATLLEALVDRQTRSLVQRITFHGGDLLAASLVWLGGLSLLLAQFLPGLLLVAVGFLLQLHDEPPPDEPDLEQRRLLKRYSVRDVVQHNGQDGGQLPAARRPPRLVQALAAEPGASPPAPARGGSDGSALPLNEGPSLRSRVISITAELGTAWRKLDELNAQTLLVVDDYRIVGVCSREQLLAYLRSRATVPEEKESE